MTSVVVTFKLIAQLFMAKEIKSNSQEESAEISLLLDSGPVFSD